MPDKTLTVATYAAGASLAAITLIYVFGPTYLLDSSASASGPGLAGLSSNRKNGVVGLSNPANDCFINSVLQALAGLGDLRLYLIREIHRRSLDPAVVYAQAIPPQSRGPEDDRWSQMEDWKIEGLQSGIVTKGLKDILDALNERPIYKKTITAAPFVRSLEAAFRQRISRQQQDAQEFLQVVAERLCDEYHAGRKARNYVRRQVNLLPVHTTLTEPPGTSLVEQKLAALALDGAPQRRHPRLDTVSPAAEDKDSRQRGRDEEGTNEEDEEGFPMEGKFESQIECQTCQFKPRPTESTFCTLTLNVPQASSTTLNACFDGLFKTELIDDFKCEKCRLVHAKEELEADVRKSTSGSFRSKAVAAIAKLQIAIDTDPEEPLEGFDLPDIRYAPKRRIARHIRVTRFPKILAIHLSRSIFDSHTSQKNAAKVAFPERLPLGGLLQQKKYKLLGVVTHKGSHHSGHYESFRRQNVYPPFSNSNTFQPSGVYSVSGTPVSTPRINALQQISGETSPLASTSDLLSTAGDAISSTGDPQTPELGPTPSTASLKLRRTPTPVDKPSSPSRRLPKDAETSSIRSVAMSARSTLSRITTRTRSSSRAASRNGAAGSSNATLNLAAPTSDSADPVTISPTAPTTIHPTETASTAGKPPKKKKHHNDRWWRISDEKIKEATTRDVLGMQREVYLLFYEMERPAA